MFENMINEDAIYETVSKASDGDPEAMRQMEVFAEIAKIAKLNKW